MLEHQMTLNGVPPSFFPANFMWQMHEESPHHPTASLAPLLPTTQCPNPHDFRGAGTVLGKRSMSFSGIETCEEMNGEDYLSDDGSQAGEKKKRLNLEQVRTLEKNFEMGNRLEPERKMQLARALRLQPRQIAIWFQNRRARWKTKQLEKDYDALKRQYEGVKSENAALQSQNRKLQAEISALKCRETSEPINLNKETEGSCSNRSENSSDINLGFSRAAPATDTNLNPHQSRSFFQSYRTAATAQLLQNPSRSEVQCPKIENTVQDESFCNVFMDDQSAFWSWSEHHNFH